jgi:hypothetical protein
MVKRGFTAKHRNQATVVEVKELGAGEVFSNMASTLIELCIMGLYHEDRLETNMWAGTA